MKALILAAGYATRLYPLTKDRPKALLPVAGLPILDRICKEIVTIPDVNEIIVVSNHRFVSQFLAWQAAAEKNYSVPLTILDDFTTSDEDKLGAIGDIQFVIERLAIREPLLVVAGDNLFTYHLIDAWRVFREFDQDMILAAEIDSIEDLRRFAVAEIDENNIVLSLEEKPLNPRSNLAVYATYFYVQDTIPLVQEYLEQGGNPDAPGNFPAWLYKRKPLRLYEFDGECFDIGTPSAYAEVEEFMLRYENQRGE
ncbi:MAG: nucleotidyltransferase family protein [Clostridia bacterium]|nr:nucleotidyltransferase family protein [Clostridia bacterium]